MKNIWCFFGFHKFGKWKHIGMKGKYQERLKRRCGNCGKLEFYDGGRNLYRKWRKNTIHI